MYADNHHDLSFVYFFNFMLLIFHLEGSKRQKEREKTARKQQKHKATSSGQSCSDLFMVHLFVLVKLACLRLRFSSSF